MTTTKPTPPPDGCVSVADHERALTHDADVLETEAQKLLAGAPNRVATATAKELLLGAIRARRVASELAILRERIDHRRELMEHHKLMMGVKPARRLKRNP